VVKEAVAQGIPVLTLDSFINSEDARCRIGTDNIEAGRKCAEALKRSIAPGATVAVFSYIRGSSTAIDREAGLRQGLGDQFPLLPTRYSNAESAIAYTQAKQLLAEHPGIGGMVALNEPTTLGVARALRESGRARQIPLVGVDNAFMVMKYVEDGTVRDAIVQQPFNMGYLSVVTARQVLDGKRVPRAIDTGSVDIDKTTMFLQQNQKLLFPVNDVVP
jgi:ribose transport system substrate-binding protein